MSTPTQHKYEAFPKNVTAWIDDLESAVDPTPADKSAIVELAMLRAKEWRGGDVSRTLMHLLTYAPLDRRDGLAAVLAAAITEGDMPRVEYDKLRWQVRDEFGSTLSVVCRNLSQTYVPGEGRSPFRQELLSRLGLWARTARAVYGASLLARSTRILATHQITPQMESRGTLGAQNKEDLAFLEQLAGMEELPPWISQLYDAARQSCASVAEAVADPSFREG